MRSSLTTTSHALDTRYSTQARSPLSTPSVQAIAPGLYFPACVRTPFKILGATCASFAHVLCTSTTCASSLVVWRTSRREDSFVFLHILVGVTSVEGYKAMHRTNTILQRQVDAAFGGLSDGEHTSRTRRVFVE